MGYTRFETSVVIMGSEVHLKESWSFTLLSPTNGLNQPLGCWYCMYGHTHTHFRESFKLNHFYSGELLGVFMEYIRFETSVVMMGAEAHLEGPWSLTLQFSTNGLNQLLGYRYCMYAYTCTHSRELHAHSTIGCKNKLSIKFLYYKNNFII